jgi:hypothetical protein
LTGFSSTYRRVAIVEPPNAIDLVLRRRDKLLIDRARQAVGQAECNELDGRT